MRFAALVILVALFGAATATDQPDEGPYALAEIADATPWQISEPGTGAVDETPWQVSEAGTVDATPLQVSEPGTGAVDETPWLVSEPEAGTVDATPLQVSEPEAGTVEATPPQVSEPEAGTVEATPLQVSEPEAGTVDATPLQVSEPEAGTVEATPLQVSEPEAGTVDATPRQISESVATAADVVQVPDSPAPTPDAGLTDQTDVVPKTAKDKLSEELDSFCQRVDEKLSSVDHRECLRIGLVDGGADSNKATPLLFKDFGAKDNASPARVLLIGGIHGDEYSSVSIVFKWLGMLEEDLGDRFHWRVIPVLNPDGLLMPPRMSRRMNANGVDLNRNFPTPDWEAEAHQYWIHRALRNERRYPGPAPLSEPETAWLVEQIESFRPHAVVAVHAPHGVVDFDGPRVPPRQLGPLELKLLGTYPGSMGRYIGIHKGIPLLTLELESAFGMPVQNEVYAIWYDMLGWLYEKIELPLKLAEESKISVPENDLVRVRSAADEG